MEKFIICILLILTFSIYAKEENGINGRLVVSWTPKIIQIDTAKGASDTLVFDSTNCTKGLTKMDKKAKIYLGESLKYEVTWGFITAGFSEIKVDSILHRYKGRDCYKIYSIAISSQKVDFFGHKVRDTSFVYYDVKTHRPLMFDKVINEGDFHRKRRVYFDHNNQTALYNGKVIKMGKFTQDVLGSIFMVRNGDLKNKKSIIVDVVDDGNFYSLNTIIRKKETVDVDYGTYKAFKVEPILQSDGIFKNEGKMWIWFTDDERKLPIKLQAKITLGSVKVSLQKYTPGVEYKPVEKPIITKNVKIETKKIVSDSATIPLALLKKSPVDSVQIINQDSIPVSDKVKDAIKTKKVDSTKLILDSSKVKSVTPTTEKTDSAKTE